MPFTGAVWPDESGSGVRKYCADDDCAYWVGSPREYIRVFNTIHLDSHGRRQYLLSVMEKYGVCSCATCQDNFCSSTAVHSYLDFKWGVGMSLKCAQTGWVTRTLKVANFKDLEEYEHVFKYTQYIGSRLILPQIPRFQMQKMLRLRHSGWRKYRAWCRSKNGERRSGLPHTLLRPQKPVCSTSHVRLREVASAGT